MTKVFISYSRKDKVFAGKLTEALQKSDLETWIDWEDIPPTSDWMDQIHKGIEEADGFLFLLSPDSVASRVCVQEVEHAVKNGKRLIPIVTRDINPSDVHPALAKVNWIYGRESDDLNEAIEKTLSAIRTDLAWVEAHRRLQVRALEWEKRQDRSRLLRGKDLREAEEQLARAGQKDPQPTDLQRRYVLASRRGESRTRNQLLTSSAVIMVALVFLSIFALNQRNTANKNALTAVANEHVAQTAQANAESERRAALSNGLSSSALLLEADDEISLALLLSVQANEIAETARSRNALFTVLKQNEQMLSVLPVPEVFLETYASFRTNADSDLLLAKIHDMLPGTLDAQYVLWDLNSHQMLDNKIFPADSPISVNPETRQLQPDENGLPFDGMLESISMSQFFLGSLNEQVEDVVLLPDGRTAVAAYCKFSKHMASRCVQLGVFVFDIHAHFFAPRDIFLPASALNFLEIAYDQNNQLFALADAGGGNIELWQDQDGNLSLLNTIQAPGFVSLQEVRGVEFIPDLQLIAWGTGDNKVILWDTKQGAVAEEYQFDFPFRAFVISPDGKLLAVQTESGTKIYARAGAGLQPVETGIDPVNTGAMAFGGGGRRFAIGAGYRIWVFDTSTWSQIANIELTSTGDSDIYNLSISRDGTTLAVGLRPVQAGPTEKSYLVDIQTGLETGPFDEIVDPIISPDNRQLASMRPYLHQGIALWSLDIDLWKAHACQVANRNLTQAEWGQYMGNLPYQPTCSNLSEQALNTVPVAAVQPTSTPFTPEITTIPTTKPDQLIAGLEILPKAGAAQQSGVKSLAELASERYSEEQIAGFGDTIPIDLTGSIPLSFGTGWCAQTKQILDENLRSLQFKLRVNGSEIPNSHIATQEFVQDGWSCLWTYMVINNWEPGDYHISYTGETSAQINDGTDNFGPGILFGQGYRVSVP